MPFADAHAAPTGSFNEFNFQKEADGYVLSANPVDDSASNNVVAVNDAVGLKLNSVTTDAQAVTDAVISLDKPACFRWDNDTQTALTTTQEKITYSVTAPSPWDSAAETLSVQWSQKGSGAVTTPVFRVRATQDCQDGFQWTPRATVTDGSGSRTITLDPITVRSTISADVIMTAVGAPTYQENGSDVVATTKWEVKLKPETISKVGYRDPAGDISIDVAFTGPRSTFEVPFNPKFINGVGCWTLDGSSVGNGYPAGQNLTNPGSQRFTARLSKNAECMGLLEKESKFIITAKTSKQHYCPSAGATNLNLQGQATSTAGWADRWGNPIPDSVLTNNTDTRTLECNPTSVTETKTIETSQIWSTAEQPTTDAHWTARPFRVYNEGTALSSGKQPAGGIWQPVSTNADRNVGWVGPNGLFQSEAHYEGSWGTLTNLTSYHLFDPAKQRLDIEQLPQVGQLSKNAGGNAAATPYPTSAYTVMCTTDYQAGADLAAMRASAAQPGNFTWAECSTLPVERISGVRFMHPGGQKAPTTVHSQVPFIAVGQLEDRANTIIRWSFDEIANSSRPLRGEDVAVKIAGNKLLLNESADVEQVQPQSTVTYTLTPETANPYGTFSATEVPNYAVTQRFDKYVTSIDTSKAEEAGWIVQVTPPEGDSGYVVTYTRTETVMTGAALPAIITRATYGLVLPQTNDPKKNVVKNSARATADFSEGPANSAKDLPVNLPEQVFLHKSLISDPVIQVEDPDVAWRIEWVNYNKQPVGQARFVDVFPFPSNDDRGRFTGDIKLARVEAKGSAQNATWEMTTASPATVGTAPADSVMWQAVNIADPASWPAGATALRITLPNLGPGEAGYGAADLHFTVAKNKEFDVYGNNVSGTYTNTLLTNPTEQSLGTVNAEKVRVIASSISGLVWADVNTDPNLNDNGKRDQGETLVADTVVKLYKVSDAARDGEAGQTAQLADNAIPIAETRTNAQGEYRFTGLRGGRYVVLFDKDVLKDKGYRLTAKVNVEDTAANTAEEDASTVDSDAAVDTGRSHYVNVPIDQTPTEDAPGDTADIVHVDAGLIPLGITFRSADHNAAVTYTYAWDLVKTATPQAPEPTRLAVDYTVTVTEGARSVEAVWTGTMTLENVEPKELSNVDITMVSDGEGITCVVNNGTPVTFPARESKVVPFACNGQPGDDTERVATVTMRIPGKADVITTTLPAVTYTVAEHNKTVTLTDNATLVNNKNSQTLATPAQNEQQFVWSEEGTTHPVRYTLDTEVASETCVTFANTAKLTSNGKTVTEQATSTRSCTPEPPTPTVRLVEQDASVSRDYAWNIAKTAEKAQVTTDSVTLPFAVTVTEGERTTTASTWTGELEVINTHGEAAQVRVDLQSSGTGLTCVVNGGAPVELGEGSVDTPATATVDFTCTGDPGDELERTATATVTLLKEGTNAKPYTTDLTATTYKLTETNKTVTVSDTAVLSDGFPDTTEKERTFGPYTWSAAGTQHSENYSLAAEKLAPATCVTAENTATLSTGVSSKADAKGCTPDRPVFPPTPPVTPQDPPVVPQPPVAPPTTPEQPQSVGVPQGIKSSVSQKILAATGTTVPWMGLFVLGMTGTALLSMKRRKH